MESFHRWGSFVPLRVSDISSSVVMKITRVADGPGLCYTTTIGTRWQAVHASVAQRDDGLETGPGALAESRSPRLR